MSIEVTDTQMETVKRGEPLRFRGLDMEFVVLRADLYEQLLEDDVRATAELVDRVMAEDDANDPHLASYQTMSARRQP